jgi:hypothetical protein
MGGRATVAPSRFVLFHGGSNAGVGGKRLTYTGAGLARNPRLAMAGLGFPVRDLG